MNHPYYYIDFGPWLGVFMVATFVAELACLSTRCEKITDEPPVIC